MNKIILLAFGILWLGCKNDAELTMERGIQYYEWNLIDKSIIEFKKVIHMFPENTKKLTYENLELLSQAHHNLAVAYAKKEWYDEAEKEARFAFEMVPTIDNRKVLDLIIDKK